MSVSWLAAFGSSDQSRNAVSAGQPKPKPRRSQDYSRSMLAMPSGHVTSCRRAAELVVGCRLERILQYVQTFFHMSPISGIRVSSADHYFPVGLQQIKLN